MPEGDTPRFDAQAIKTAILQDDRRFGIALALAIAVHAMLLVGFNTPSSSSQRRLGDPGGADEAISVAIVTEADLRGRAAVDDQAKGVPAPQAPPAQAAPPPQPPPQPQSNPMTDAAPQKEAALTEPVLTGEGLKKVPETSQKQPAKPAEQIKPADAKEREKREQPSRPPQRSAKLDLTPPPTVFAAPFGGGGAGVERPPGITRSGENDAFARGVIRALQRTMPQLSNTRGRVTVRITLDKNGSLVRTQVLRPSQVAGLDQNVVFATRQSSFPLPPRNAVPVDLVFVVTYIYR